MARSINASGGGSPAGNGAVRYEAIAIPVVSNVTWRGLTTLKWLAARSIIIQE